LLRGVSDNAGLMQFLWLISTFTVDDFTWADSAVPACPIQTC
jgi:hypothetical protein